MPSFKDQDPKKPRVRVAIVPYADAVNTGSLASNVYVETKFTNSEPPALRRSAGRVELVARV